MEAPRLVASDVDGTLLGPDYRVPPRTLAAIGRLRAAGVPFVLVTGRPPRWIPPVCEQLGFTPFSVCGNGATLYDAAADRVLSARTLDPSTLARLADAVDAVLPGAHLGVERVATSAADDAFVAEPGYRSAWDGPDRRVTEERPVLLATPAVKLLVRAPELASDAMVAALAPVVGAAADLTFSSSHGLVEVATPGITKAAGLAQVAERFGVAAADVVAFGDMPNDLEMLRWAGHGVAMGNAHPALAAVADEVTGSNAEDGMATVLERWF